MVKARVTSVWTVQMDVFLFRFANRGDGWLAEKLSRTAGAVRSRLAHLRQASHAAAIRLNAVLALEQAGAALVGPEGAEIPVSNACSEQQRDAVEAALRGENIFVTALGQARASRPT